MEQLIMNTNNITLDSTTNDFAHKKFHKIIKLLPKTATIHLVFSQEKLLYRIDANTTMPGQQFHTHDTGASFYICIKHLAEKVLRQITNSKQKIS